MLETAISLSALDAYGMFQRLSGRAEIPSQQQKYIPQSCLHTALSTVNASRPLDAHPTPLTRQPHARDQYLRFDFVTARSRFNTRLVFIDRQQRWRPAIISFVNRMDLEDVQEKRGFQGSGSRLALRLQAMYMRDRRSCCLRMGSSHPSTRICKHTHWYGPRPRRLGNRASSARNHPRSSRLGR